MIRKGSRVKQQGEPIPPYEIYELRHKGNPIQVCWDYTEVADEETGQVDYRFLAVNIPDLKEETMQAAGVPQEIINQICS